MAAKKSSAPKSSSKKKSSSKSAADEAPPRYRPICAVKPGRVRALPTGLGADRAAAIASVSDKWVNGTVLSYYFFDQATDGETVHYADGSSEFISWRGAKAQADVVRKAFATWKALGIGLEFKEVTSRDQATLRIGFMAGNGSWSYVGRDVLDIGKDQRTMNFGWNIANDADTAIHEIGHSLGFNHEHQNPFAGIVWDEEAVYNALAQPPNSWPREKTHYNIIRKLPEGSVQGTEWDKDSVMHYPFEAGLIKQPAIYQTQPLQPAGGLSARDKSYVKQLYPPLQPVAKYPVLKLLESRKLKLKAGEQLDLLLEPTSSRYYEIRTFGTADTVVVLFEQVGGDLKYRAGDDDSGEDRNAYLKQRLTRGAKYVLRIRLYYADRPGETGVMWW